MGDKEDLRIKRTKKLLSNSLKELMEETPYNKITINDVCDRAMVHRATFYNHFYDKDDLFNYILSSISDEMFEKAIAHETFFSSKEMYLSIISCVIDYLAENRSKIVKILDNNNERLIRVVFDALYRSVKYYNSKGNFVEEYTIPQEVLMNFFIGGLSCLGLNYLEGKLNYNKQELMDYCNILLNEKTFIKNKY